MQLTTFLPLVLASIASVQAVTLMEALAAQNSTLSMLNSLLATQPALTEALASASGITLLAPSNEAFSKFITSPANKAAASDSATLMGLLQYHVLNGTMGASSFTTTEQFITTMLMPLGSTTAMASGNSTKKNTTMDRRASTSSSSMGSNLTMVTGGQVVGGMRKGDKVMVMSGLKEVSTVTTADIMFTGGVMHIIDTVLTLPPSVSTTALSSNLTALAGALTQTNLLTAVNTLSDVTIFAPSNAAFQAIGSAASTLTTQQLSSILEYHVINGTVGYSSLLTTGLANESFPTLGGGSVMVNVEDGKVFVNSAQVIITDVLVSNGVVHVIDNVLNPSNTTVMPNPTATSQAVAFADVSAAPNVPFTSGIMASTTAPSASTKTAAAVKNAEVGMMGAAALFGMVAVAGL